MPGLLHEGRCSIAVLRWLVSQGRAMQWPAAVEAAVRWRVCNPAVARWVVLQAAAHVQGGGRGRTASWLRKALQAVRADAAAVQEAAAGLRGVDMRQGKGNAAWEWE